MSTSSSPFHQVNPANISIPSNASGVITALNKIKAVLILLDHNLGVAINQILAHHANIDTAGKNHTALEGLVQNIKSTIIGLTAQISTLLGGGGSKRKLKLQEPPNFDGKDKTKATAFRTLVTHYIRVVDPSASAEEQIAFIISHLEGDAKTWLNPFEERDLDSTTMVPWLHNITQFWSQFNTRWNVQNHSENYCAKFMALHQGAGSVQDYFKDFQTYSEGLGYNDASLQDHFYSGLNVKSKETLMLQNYQHTLGSLDNLARKSLENDKRLREFQRANKGALATSTSAPSSSKKETLTSTAPQGSPRTRMTVGEKVYLIGQDGKAKKGTITKIGKNKKGLAVPTIKWNDGTEEVSTFKGLNKDKYPAAAPSFPKPPKPSGSGPQPMDLNAASSSSKRGKITCNTCGGKGHYASQCPSQTLSGQGAELLSNKDELENKDL